MYVVVGFNLNYKYRIIFAEKVYPSEAYDLAHELDAAVNLGRDEKGTDKYDSPVVITIEDQHGNNVWRECCEARCPTSPTSLFGNQDEYFCFT